MNEVFVEAYVKDFLNQCREWQTKIKRDLTSINNVTDNVLSELAHLKFTINRFKLACSIVNYNRLSALLGNLELLLATGCNEQAKCEFSKKSTDLIALLLENIEEQLTTLESNEQESDKDISDLLNQVESVLTEKTETKRIKNSIENTEFLEEDNERGRHRQTDYIKEFLIESYDNLEKLEKDLLQLEQTPKDKSLVSGIFRMFHTIKGSSGIVGLAKTESIVHSGESLVGKLRDDKVKFSSEISDILFRVVDVLRGIFANLEKTQTEGDFDYTDLVDELSRLQLMQTLIDDVDIVKTTTTDTPLNASKAVKPKPIEEKTKYNHIDTSPYAVCTDSAASDSFVFNNSSPEIATPSEASDIHNTLNTQSVENNQDTKVPVSYTIDNQYKEIDNDQSSHSISERSIRIDIDLLDQMMDQVGELVLTRNQIIQVANSVDVPPLNAPSQALNLITAELQNMVMKTRMRAIRSIWDKFPRMVRDLAQTEHKKVLIEVEGADTELDRSMLEQIKDPLMHLVRNAIDHGIELPEERLKKGKSAEGVLTLRAYNEAGKVDIEISDDGAGIDAEVIKQKALSTGFINREKANNMTEQEALELIFEPGLSTARKVTNVSGRGVGMDVVKTNIEKIGGSISLETEPDKGCRFLIKIPLTLVIIPTLLITCQNERYAIAQANIVELVDLEDEDCINLIEYVHDVPIYRLRGQLLPLIFLGELLQTADIKRTKQMTHFSIVVVKIGVRQFGLIVDEISDSQEIVIKPLSKQLQKLKCYAGATILGDGSVALVLDVLGIIQMADLLDLANEKAVKEQVKLEKTLHQDNNSKDANLHALLLFEDLTNEKMAIPFDKAVRLEEFSIDQIENVGCEDVVQYRGNIMPLIYLPNQNSNQDKQFLTSLKLSDENDDRNTVHVVVISRGADEVGLVVSNILDIVEEEITIKDFSQLTSSLFTSVVQGHVVEILDVDRIVSNHFPSIAEKGLA